MNRNNKYQQLVRFLREAHMTRTLTIETYTHIHQEALSWVEALPLAEDQKGDLMSGIEMFDPTHRSVLQVH